MRVDVLAAPSATDPVLRPNDVRAARAWQPGYDVIASAVNRIDPRAVVEFPVLSALGLSAFWAAPFTGAPWVERRSAGLSAGRSLAYASGIPAPIVGSNVNGRTAASFISSAIEDPSGFANLLWWGRGDNVSLVSGKAHVVLDKSGNGHDLTTDPASFADANYIASAAMFGNQPVLGWLSTPSAGSGWKMNSGSVFSQTRPFVVYAVFAYNIPSTTEANTLGWILNDTSVTTTFAWELESGGAVNYHGTYGDAGVTISDLDVYAPSIAHVACLQIEAVNPTHTQWSLYLDSYTTPVFTSTQLVTAGGTLTDFYIGSCPSLTGGGIANQFAWAESFIHAGVHDAATRKTLMQAYLATRYGLTVTP